MRRNYVQSESFENDLFQYVFARWNYRIAQISVADRHQRRFTTEIRNILLERQEKIEFRSGLQRLPITLRLKRIVVWFLTLAILVGAIYAVFLVNRFNFRVRLCES
jgi:hypothetical protein